MPLTGTEAPGIFAWLRSTLAGDATIQASVGAPPNARVYQDNVPEGTTTWPCIVFATQANAPDTRPVGKVRVMATKHVIVKAIDQSTSYATVAPLAARIDELIEGQRGTGTFAGANTAILSCTREHEVEYPETDPGTGRAYRHLGGVYKIQAQQTG